MSVVADVNENYPLPSAYVERAVIAGVMRAVHATKFAAAEDYLAKRFPKDCISSAVLRGVAPVADSTTAGNAAELVQSAVRSYLASLTPDSAAAELIRRGVDAQLSIYGTAIYPGRSSAPVAAPWVAEGEPIPVFSRPLTSVTVGPTRKLALIATLTEELAKRGNGEAIIAQVLREDVSAGLDAAYFSTTAPSDAAHAGLLYGVSPLDGYAGADLTAATEDLSRLAAAVSANGSGEVLFVSSPQNVATFGIRFPDLAPRVSLLASPAVGNSRVIAVDPRAVLHAVDGLPDISVETAPVLHMSDAPAEIVTDAGTVADPVRSLWQTGGVAIRLMLNLAFSKRRSTAVAYVDGISWGVA